MNWEEKILKKHQEEIKVLDKKLGEISPWNKMLISTPKIIYNYINQIPKGKFIGQIKKYMLFLA